MHGITPISWKKFEKFLLFIGCVLSREKGDHRIYRKTGLKRPIVIPRDATLPIFIVRNNLRVLNITPEDYIEILKKI